MSRTAMFLSSPRTRWAIRTRILLVPIACVVLASAHDAGAQSLSVLGAPSLTITAAAPGGGLVPATSSSATYSLTTSAADQHIVARLTSCLLPSGVSLSADMSGATSRGPVPLSSTSAELLGPIASVGTVTGTITYRLTATAAAGPVATTGCAVEITLEQAPP